MDDENVFEARSVFWKDTHKSPRNSNEYVFEDWIERMKNSILYVKMYSEGISPISKISQHLDRTCEGFSFSLFPSTILI